MLETRRKLLTAALAGNMVRFELMRRLQVLSHGCSLHCARYYSVSIYVVVDLL